VAGDRSGVHLFHRVTLLRPVHCQDGAGHQSSASDARLSHNDGLDYVPTNQYVLFGHHFAAIAGAGPLVGPVLAAQMGYLPGTLWILAGVVFAGAVQDMTVLFLSGGNK
jgi:carbon starvation protein CstA